VDDSLTLLVDAPSLIYRALFSTPDTIRTREGTPINAAYGFLRMLARLIADNDPDYLACAADDNWRPEWRVELLPSYKAQRAEPGSQQEQSEELLAPQVPIAYEVLAQSGVNVVGHPEFEAEDIIGTLAARAPGKVAIFSGDRDLFQLVEDPKTTVIYPIRGVSKIDVINERYIEDKYGIPGRAYRDFAVLRGDPSDGLPGVRGIGDKLAESLIVKYGTIDKIVEVAEAGEQGQALAKVKKDLDYVKRAVEVVTIRTDVPLPDIDLSRPRDLAGEKIIDDAKDLGIQGPVRSLVGALVGSA
jgi:5'-3' exonuclease